MRKCEGEMSGGERGEEYKDRRGLGVMGGWWGVVLVGLGLGV